MSNQTTNTNHPFYKRPWVNNGLWILGAFVVYMLLRPIMQGDVIQGKVPNLALTTLTGQIIHLQDIKQPTLIEIWATWCPICRTMNDSIVNISKDHPVISIATQSDSERPLKRIVEKRGLSPKMVIDDHDGTLLKRFGARAVPASFIVDAKGNIRFVEVGYTSEWGLRLRLWLASF